MFKDKSYGVLSSKVSSEAESHIPEKAIMVNVFEGAFLHKESQLDVLCRQRNHDCVLVFLYEGDVSLL